MSTQTETAFTIIVPVHNGAEFLSDCLQGIQESKSEQDEIIVVDDASTDSSHTIAQDYNVRLISIERQSGPSAARNRAAEEANNNILFFVDADVVVNPQTLQLAKTVFSTQPEIAALFGSYDTNPTAPNFIAQYKNLLHHFVHQRGAHEAQTFWAGCGAVRKETFASIGGFDAKSFPRPSVEDIELGYRLRAQGFHILLIKEMQVCHLKRWTLRSLFYTDIFCRAIPWTKLLVQHPNVAHDLNLQLSQKLSAVLTLMLILSLPLVWWSSWFLLLTLLFLGLLVWLNRSLYKFFLAHRGLWFALRTVPLQFIYYIYSSASFILAWLYYKGVKRNT